MFRCFYLLFNCTLLLLFAAVSSSAAGSLAIAPAAADFVVIRGGGSEIALDKTTGKILSVRSQSVHSRSVAATPSGGDLWSLRMRGGQTIRASDCLKRAPLKIRTLSAERLELIYSAGREATVTVDVEGSSAGVDLRLAVRGLPDDVLGAALPDDLSFSPATLRRVLFPQHLGIALKPAFFGAHALPVSWSHEPISAQGLQRVAGITCRTPPTDTPAVPIRATALAQQLFGADLASAWQSAPQVVSRPSIKEPDTPLLVSDSGAFLGGHKVGQGMLLRFGGWPAASQSALMLPTIEKITAAAAHSPELLGLPPHPSDRSRVVLIAPKYDAGANAVVNFTAEDLQNAFAAAGVEVQVSTADTPAALLSALADAHTLAVVNPFGESFPAGSDWSGMLDAIHGYLNSGGAWLETGGYSFYYRLQGNPYASLEDQYPSRSFCDFARIEASGGALDIYGVQNALDKQLVMTPSSWRAFGDASGGHLQRSWQTFLSISGGETPILRLRMSDADPASALRAYARANGLVRTLSAKMPPAVLALWKRCVTIKLVSSTVDEEAAMLSHLPDPAVLHEVSYLHGGFDRQYPDHLPPGPKYGTPAQFRHFLALAHQKGDLVMPYTNTTWWPDNPKGTTFLSTGDGALLVGLDGRHVHEVYGPGSSGWSITPFDHAVTASVDRLMTQLKTEYPVDVYFGDQNGARPLEYDLNPASPTPYAYTQGMINLAAQAGRQFPTATEDGFDRLINVESEFCGLTQEIVPFPYDQSQLLSRRMPDADWEFFPMAQYVAHDKAFFIHHDLGSGVWNDEALAWSLALGYGLSCAVSPSDLADPTKKAWLEHLATLQGTFGPAYMGAPLLSFRYLAGSGSQGVIAADYGKLRVIANLSETPYKGPGFSDPLPTHGVRLALARN